MLRGFDVSHYQGAVDWASLKTKYGIVMGAAKATEAEGGKDSQFGTNWRKMKEAGLVRLAYSYGHPDNDPADDAKAFLDYVNASGGIGPEDIMVMDMEVNDLKLPLLQVRDWLAGWADIVTEATGRKPFLYAGSGWIRNNTTLGLKAHYAAWWYPEYPSAYDGHTSWPDSITGYPATNNWGGAPDIWQFSQSFGGKNMDADVANMALDDLKTRGVVKPSKPPVTPPPVVTPPPTTKDIIDMATQAEVAQAVSDGMRDYLHDFYTPGQGTGWQYHQDVLAAIKAQTDALNKLADALTPKP